MSHCFNLASVILRIVKNAKEKKYQNEILHPDEQYILSVVRKQKQEEEEEEETSYEGRSQWSGTKVSTISTSTEIGSSIEKRKRTEWPYGEIRTHRLEHLTRLA